MKTTFILVTPRHSHDCECCRFVGSDRDDSLRAAWAACKAAERAWGGPVRGPADSRAKEEMYATVRDIGEAMLSLRRAGARFGIDLAMVHEEEEPGE